MKLKDWRGVSEREISFDDGVTILEGPNEIGKSSIVEALLMLINDIASSSKAVIKNVQPVGRDVGSSVEAEITVGESHFIYRKVFNKGKTTELSILAPINKQLAGREAHDYVLELLNETVDLDLWKALLVDQGGQIAPVDLKDSQSLSSALDAAAAGTASTGEDVALLQAAKYEYENYFTQSAKTRAKWIDLEKAVDQAESDLTRAMTELRDVEQDAERHQSLDIDIRRRHAEMPLLQRNYQKHRANKRATDTLRGELKIALSQVDAAQERQRVVSAANSDRSLLIKEITAGEKLLAEEDKAFAPFQERVSALEKKLIAASQANEKSAKSRRHKTKALDVARDDLAHIEKTLLFVQEKKLAETVAKTEEKLSHALEQIAGITIDQEGLVALQDAESDRRVAQGQRDHAATSVALTAEKDVTLIVDGESEDIAKGATREQTVSSSIQFEIPGIASIRVSPPKSAADLDHRLQEAQLKLNYAMTKYGASNLDEAATALARKQGAQQEAERQKGHLSSLLGDRTSQEVQHDILKLQRECESYLEARDANSSVPENAVTAQRALDAALSALQEFEREQEVAQHSEREFRNTYDKADKELQDAQNSRSSLQATLEERRRRLASVRADTSDADLMSQFENATTSITALTADVSRLKGELNQLSADTVEGLFENAEAALSRAKTDLAKAEQQRAVFEDRLTRAKADGRFETRELAESTRDRLKEELSSKNKKAAASRRLWETLNKHRNDARQAYVRPLRDAIERLGRIVYGPDFQIVVADDWTISTRTLNGSTLPYDSLSIGAKEQLGILTRLAAGQIVSEHGGVPLIIDDALGFSDPLKLETMGAAIATAGKSCQVIILTCVPGRFTHVGTAKVQHL